MQCIDIVVEYLDKNFLPISLFAGHHEFMQQIIIFLVPHVSTILYQKRAVMCRYPRWKKVSMIMSAEKSDNAFKSN